MSGSSYTQKVIDVLFTKQTGTFADSGTNQIRVSGLRIAVDLVQSTPGVPGTANGHIYGLTPSLMRDLSTMGMRQQHQTQNTIAIYAGDATSGLPLVFTGTIYEAWANFDSMPNVSLQFSANTSLDAALAPISPTSYRGSADVATIIQGIAAQIGRSFENNGVSGYRLSNPYFRGNAKQQIENAVAHTGIMWTDDGKTIAIWPPGGTRGGAIPLIGPSSGLIGYPRYTRQGVDFTCVFNPNIQFGGKVQIESTFPQACGIYHVVSMTHNLQSQTPGGSWSSSVSTIDPSIYEN